MRLVFFLEELSMKVFLECLFPRIYPQLRPTEDYILVAHEGKDDLERSLTNKLPNWNVPGDYFIVIRDNDATDCKATKAKLINLVKSTGKTKFLIRLACEELEAWYLGDLVAVGLAYSKRNLAKRNGNKAKLRNPDTVQKPSAKLAQMVPEFQKVQGARLIARHIDRSRNKSRSFHVLLEAIDNLI